MKKTVGKVICYNSLIKSLNGSKVLLISPTEEASRRIWFELQKAGKQSTFYTVPLPFPTEKIIEEGYDIAIRTGISNIITIGSGSICDIGKGISTLIEKNVKKVSDLDKIKKVSKSNKIPVVSIGSTISPVYSTSSWLCLHQEDDLLVSRSCSTVNEVVFDYDLIQKSLTYCKEATLGYLLANLYDTIFAYCLDQCIKGYEVTSISEQLSLKITSYLEAINKTTSNKDSSDDLNNYSNLAFILGNLRSDIYSSNNTSIEASRWPGIIEKACLINFLRQDRISRPPFSWYVSALLPICIERLNSGDNDDNKMISMTTKLTFKIFSEVVDYDKLTTTIMNSSKASISRIMKLQEIDKKNHKDKGTSTSGSQLLEIAIMNAEYKEDDINYDKQDALLQMLNSDVMLDLTEKIFDSPI